MSDDWISDWRKAPVVFPDTPWWGRSDDGTNYRITTRANPDDMCLAERGEWRCGLRREHKGAHLPCSNELVIIERVIIDPEET